MRSKAVAALNRANAASGVSRSRSGGTLEVAQANNNATAVQAAGEVEYIAVTNHFRHRTSHPKGTKLGGLEENVECHFDDQ